MTNNKGIKKRFKCQLCRTVVWTEKEFLKHLLSHFNGERCPICNMKAKHKALHLAEYHIHPNKLALLERDLAVLIKESGNYEILKDPQFSLTKQEIKTIKRLVKEL